ncbi:hypothetical protein C8Q80DRAFT_930929 [Daedaleopsis nitida]|nr:hypothetical protein C8Q80DRAFT_930929 [Daedaleopsis nitida]
MRMPCPPPPPLRVSDRLPPSGPATDDPIYVSRNSLALPDLPSDTHKISSRLLPSPALVNILNLRGTPPDLLWRLFEHACVQKNLPVPAPLFPPPHSRNPSNLVALFAHPDDARTALSLSCDIFAVTPSTTDQLLQSPITAREIHTERDPSFKPLDANPPPFIPQVHDDGHSAHTTSIMPHPHSRPSDRVQEDFMARPVYPLSSNPPNPKSSFRTGDWMCIASNCGAHNFQRNTSCIACGRFRSGLPALPAAPARSSTFPLANPSPRFAGRVHHAPSMPISPPASTPSFATGSDFSVRLPPPAHALAAAQAQMPSRAPPPQYPPLTPSGRTVSVGGRVRNISRDPLAPCVMYWPDNEPLPEPCQIRPMDSALLTYPPIINTGNKGAAEKQPGDWLCGKCNYHNWRRRKVCQTCYPYAEGNGDSISANVQAERIALLANVLSEFNAIDLNRIAHPAPPHPHHLAPTSAPPYSTRFVDGPSSSVANSRNGSPVLRPLPFTDLGKPLPPIYQTPVNRTEYRPHPVLAPSPLEATLLPSFLQDIVHSPSQSPSPTSSSSAELSFDGDDGAHYVLHAPGHSHYAYARGDGMPRPVAHALYEATARKARGGSSSTYSSLDRSSGSSIWQLDGEESRTLSSTSSSARTSPTTAFAQIHAVHRGAPIPTVAAPAFPIGAASPVDSGTTPKNANGFWKSQA